MNIRPDSQFRYFSIISSVFVAVLLVANTVATKLFSLGPFIFTGAIIIFPISYIFGDILTEVYGYSRSRKIIWTGFICLTFMSIIYWIVGLLPAAPGWNNQASYVAVLGVVPRIVLASILGYWAGEFSNSLFTSNTSPETGINKSETVLTASTVPKISPLDMD